MGGFWAKFGNQDSEYVERELDAAIQWSEIYKIGKLKRLETKNFWCISKCCE
jgi:hypothetical protein